MANIRQWLEEHELGRYAELFGESEIDLEVLPDLTEEHLKELGLPMGPRLKLLAAIKSSPPEVTEARSLSIVDTSPSSPTGDAERRQLTVMFADLVGSTELSQKLDPEDLREVNRAYQDAAKAAIEQYGGYVARYMGDGVLAYFGYPQAHENDAERALRAGLALTDAVPSLSVGVALAVRVGIATGAVVVGDIIGEGAAQESAVVGETPNLAARLQGVAEPNSVIISATTEALTTGLFKLEALPTRTLKGFSDEVTLYRVQAEVRGKSRFAARSGRHLSPFVGREEELELLARRWTRAKAGRGQVVLTVGEAGIGKSRLLQQLREHIGTEPHEVIALQCSPYHESSALYPSIAAFERALGFAEVTEGAGRLKALQLHLEEIGETGEQTLGLLAHLLSIPTEERSPPSVEATDAAQRRERTLRALIAYVRKLADRAPLLCAFEDVHWADPTTRELLGRLVEGIEGERVLLIATTRPKFDAGWTDLAHVQVLSLSRLGTEAGEKLAQAVASAMAALPVEVVQTILSRAEGNPLFIEELTRSVVQSADSFTRKHVIPATLQDSLMARLDASRTGKAVAQCAAVIGRVFGHRLLSTVWQGAPGGLSEGLDVLQHSGLISRRGEGGLAQYIFKHALVRDTAYGSLLREHRAHLHARVATALEALTPQIRSNEPELLARHFTEAGSIEQAVDLWLAAAERANARSACEECLAHVAAALPLARHLPAGKDRERKEVDLQLARARGERALRGESANETGEAYVRARDIGEDLGDPGRLLTSLEGCGRFYQHRGKYTELRSTAERMLTIAQANDEPLMLARGYDMIGLELHMTSKFIPARENYERARSAFREAGFDALSAMIYPVDVEILRALAWINAEIGYHDQALGAAEEAIERAERRNTRFQLCNARWSLNAAFYLRHDYQRLLVESQRLRAIAATEGFHFHLALGDLYSGIALGGLGQPDEAIERILTARAKFKALANPLGLNWVRISRLAVYLAQTGRYEEAIDFATEAVSTSGNTLFCTLTLIHLGEVLRLTDARGSSYSQSAAESPLKKAMAFAREQSTKTWELEAATRLSELWRDQGRRQQAHTLLSPLYDWFTEGHDAPILQEAKALLDELS